MKPAAGPRDAVPPPAAVSPETLRTWLRAVAERRDREAFAQLYAFFAPRLTTFFLRTGLSPAQTADIVQDALFAVWRKAELYDPSQSGASTWIYVIARNLRLDHLRRKSTRETAPLDDWDPVDERPTGEDVLIAAEREGQLRRAMTQLSSEQAKVLEQAYFNDKPQSAIARELGVPLGTVKSRVRLALARLRKVLDETP